jgi:hypothetical protein
MHASTAIQKTFSRAGILRPNSRGSHSIPVTSSPPNQRPLSQWL